jgi:hypothetical protein
VIRRKTPYRIGIGFARLKVWFHFLDLGWHHSTKEHTWGLFYRGGGFPFYRLIQVELCLSMARLRNIHIIIITM